MHTMTAERLMRYAARALREGNRQAYYRCAVAALDAENRWRRLMGWQPLAISARSRAIADGREEVA